MVAHNPANHRRGIVENVMNSYFIAPHCYVIITYKLLLYLDEVNKNKK